MEAFIEQIMNSYGYLGIGLLILIENVFPPIPSEVILTFGGLMTTRTNLTVLGVIISATIGSLLGAIVLYLIGKILNKDRLIKIVESKYGRLLRVKRKDIDTKPMDEEEAMIQIDLLNHDFFVFKNIDEDCISVLYKRKDGSYGIINVK